MRKLYAYKTTAGTFYIAEERGMFYAMFDGDISGGGYLKPEKTAEELARGQSFPNAFDTSKLGISSDLLDWEIVF